MGKKIRKQKSLQEDFYFNMYKLEETDELILFFFFSTQTSC